MHGRIARLGSLAIVAGLFLGVSLAPALSAQGAKDPVIGKWLLDPVTSTFSGAVPEKRVLTFEAVGADAIKQIVDTTGANGATDRSEFVLAFSAEGLTGSYTDPDDHEEDFTFGTLDEALDKLLRSITPGV